MQHPFTKLFTVDEANELLPRLRGLLADARRHRDAARGKAPDVEEVLQASPANGGGRTGSEYGVEAYRLFRAVGRIQELGVQIKDLDTGLLDFPHERDGQVVFLCWREPEESVAFWHEIEAGYAGRQPL